MKIILLGPPGSGKGTQAQLLCQTLKIPQISTGDILRKAAKETTPLAEKLRVIMDSGQLVPDAIIVEIVQERIEEKDCKQGCLFDGFPRTLGQAEALQDANIDIDVVLELAVEDEQIINRMSGRRVHPGSGRVYHLEHNPPKTPGKDDETGEDLIQRKDDSPETVKKRLEVYHHQTKPLVNCETYSFICGTLSSW